jgi:carbon monoxide dehydrogenase subunit G
MTKERKNMQGDNTCTIGYSEDQVHGALGQSVTLHVVTADVVENQKAQIKYTGDILGMHGSTTYLLSPEGNGTRLTVIMEVNGKLPPGFTYETVQGEFQKNADKTLAAIKAKAEKK